MVSRKMRRVNEFKQIAANLVEKDRASRNGVFNRKPYNLGQSIAVALEQAYLRGRQEAANSNAETDKQDVDFSFIDIPRRFQILFESIFSSETISERKQCLVPFDDYIGQYPLSALDKPELELLPKDQRFKISSAVGLEKLGMLSLQMIQGYEVYILTESGGKVLQQAAKAGDIDDLKSYFSRTEIKQDF